MTASIFTTIDNTTLICFVPARIEMEFNDFHHDGKDCHLFANPCRDPHFKITFIIICIFGPLTSKVLKSANCAFSETMVFN